MTVTVRDLLDLPLLAGARAVAGGTACAAREVAWVAVIEWPVEDFVRPAEVVLTTGVGCDEERFTRLAHDMLDSEAAAICAAFEPGGTLSEFPLAIRERAEDQGVPLVRLPWELRFADVMRAVVDRLLAERYGAGPYAPQRLFGDFATALLDGQGFRVLAATLERVFRRPVLIFDADLRLRGYGEAAVFRLGPARIAAMETRAREVDDRRARTLRALLGPRRPREIDEVPELGLAAGTTLAARAGQHTLGMLYVLHGEDGGPLGELEAGALEQAALAAGLEFLRLRSIAETETRVRGDYLWDVALGRLTDPDEMAAKGALLGHNLGQRHVVAVARVEGDLETADAAFVGLRRGLAGHARPEQVAQRDDRLLVLLPDAERAELRASLERLAKSDGHAVSWGLAEAAAPLTELPFGLASAMEALEVGRSLHGPGTVADAQELGPFLVLAALLAHDGAAGRLLELMAPLSAYGKRTSRDLLGTLEVFLQEHGNTSAAARRLHLNRHSLLHRLRRIEELTGRSLSSHDDRFLLELGLRTLKLKRGAP